MVEESCFESDLSLASILWDIDKQYRPYQTQQDAASDQGLLLLTESSIKILFKMKNTT